MSVDCYAGIAYGYIPNKEDEEFLREKFSDTIWEVFEEYNEEYPFVMYSMNCYCGEIGYNCILGEVVFESQYYDTFSFEEISLNEERREEIRIALEKLFGHEVKCDYHLFTRWC